MADIVNLAERSTGAAAHNRMIIDRLRGIPAVSVPDHIARADPTYPGTEGDSGLDIADGGTVV